MDQRRPTKSTPGYRKPGFLKEQQRGRRPRRNAARVRRVRILRIRLALILIAFFLFLILFVNLRNRWKLDITLIGDAEVTLELGEAFEDPGAHATYRGTTRKFKKHSFEVMADQAPDVNTVGTQTITYTAKYEGLTAKTSRKLTIIDTVAPTIELLTKPDYYTLPDHNYVDEGYVARDNYDGDITSRVTREEKNGMVYYGVEDSSGNRATAQRRIVYDDRTAPVITLDGGPSLTIAKDTEFKDNFVATDDVDGDLTSEVKVEGTVDTSKTGSYSLHYSCTDAHGNTAEVERSVRVKIIESEDEGYKLVYLTFDDGPSEYTQAVLDLLAKYGAKASFFVTNAFPKYQSMMRAEKDAGHVVAVHTASHDYEAIYTSEDAFWADFEAIQALIEQETGSRTLLMRFPGGSSNTISRKYKEGIMTELTRQAEERGYTYFDWNVESGDAGTSEDPAVLAENVISGMQKHNTSVVLFHDTHSFTVEALEQVLKYGQENGYTFEALTPESFPAHQNVNN